MQQELKLFSADQRGKSEVYKDAVALRQMWRDGYLGGEIMPEDVHPDLPKTSPELLHYFTLGMSLNYQRNSYSLWKSCTATFADDTVRWVFSPKAVGDADSVDLRNALLKYKVALQPNKHVANWRRVSEGILKFANGDMSKLLRDNDYDIDKIRAFVQTNKKHFPYLAGPKICNYWLFVLLQYTDFPIQNRKALTIAPDTHVLQSSVKLGLISTEQANSVDAQKICTETWADLLRKTEIVPIDFHTPLWLWSRLGFPEIRR